MCIRSLISGAALFLACCAAVAQQVPDPAEARLAPGEERRPGIGNDGVLETGVFPLPVGEPAAGSTDQAGRADEETLVLGDDEAPRRQPLDGSVAAQPAPDADSGAEASPGITNADVIEMVNAEFSEPTIVAAIQANQPSFDIAPQALLSLKSAGVPEKVMEAMLAAEAAKNENELARQPPAQTPAAGAASVEAPTELPAEVQAEMSPEALAVLAQVIERLATQAETTAPAPADVDLDNPNSVSRSPQAWVTSGGNKIALSPSIAEVAVTDEKSTGATPLKTLQGFAGKALAFANPALGIVSSLGGLFRSDDPKVTAVWALPGPSSSRSVGARTEFEIEFGGIPGVNPDEYRPAIVQLVPTQDNYRLVGAAKTKASDVDSMPAEPVIEESVAAESTQLARGRYRISFKDTVQPGEYALVLRPVVKKQRRRRSEATLGDLLGGGADDILYVTWDFSIKA